MPLFGIRMSTYWRKNGLSYFYLKRSLNSIKSQIFTNWKLFLVGDAYQFPEEIEKLLELFPKDKIWYKNLEVSPERQKYSGFKLWSVAGYTAIITSLKQIRQECHFTASLDDDDYWSEDHLAILSETYKYYPDSAFVYTQSTHKEGILPSLKCEINYNNHPPRAYGLVHSSASWDLRKIPFDYINIAETPSQYVAGDAEMWERIWHYCQRNNFKTVYVPKLTCYHDHEGLDSTPYTIQL